jgi:hypothetical protein
MERGKKMAITRETKLGIGVSCTFACLVSLIVGFKLYEEAPEDSGGGQAQTAANTAPAPPPVQTPPPDPEPELVLAPQIDDPAPAPPPPFQPTYAPPTVFPTVQPPPVPSPPVAERGAEAEQLFEMPKIGEVETEKALVRDNAQSNEPPVAAPPMPAYPPIPRPASTEGTPPPIAPVPAPPGGTPPPVAPPLAPIPQTDPALAPIPAPPAPAAAGATLEPPVTGSRFDPAPVAPPPGAAAPGGALAPVPAPPGSATTPPENKGPLVYSQNGVAPTPIPATRPIPAPPGAGATSQVRADLPGSILQPPLGAPDAGVPRMPTPAQVTIHSFEMAKIDKDATFDDLSEKKYGSKKYGAALAQFNRDNGGAAAAANGTVAANQTVFFPTTDYFEKPATPAPTAAKPAISNQPRGRVYPVYEVPTGGESVMTIAGRADHADEIMRLNPHITSVNDVLPAGTLLKLPADVQVQGANLPR